MPVRWRGYLDDASAAGNTTAYLIPPGGVARAAGRDAVRLDETGELVIGPLTAEDLPVLLPFAPIVSALIELDRRTGFLGSGTLSSSDGQRFPTKGKSIIVRALARYFGNQGLSSYTHVSDQHAVLRTKLIVATNGEAP